jgi:chromosome segregation ATPase
VSSPNAKAANSLASLVSKHANLKSQIQKNDECRPFVRSELYAHENAKQATKTAKQRRVELKSQAMLGEQCDSATIDAEIDALELAEGDAKERAEAARLAIVKLDEQLAQLEKSLAETETAIRIAMKDDFKERNNAARKANVAANEAMLTAQSVAMQTALDWQNIRREYVLTLAEEGLIEFEKLNSELETYVENMPIVERDAQQVVVGRSNDKTPHLGTVFSKMEYVLKPAAAAAEVIALVYKDDNIRRVFLKRLTSFGAYVGAAVRQKAFQSPGWAFTGTGGWKGWTSPEELEPIKKFLRDAGEDC